ARAGEPSVPSELATHNCLHYGLVPAADEWRFGPRRAAVSVPVRGSLVATDGSLLREAAVAGLGLAVLPLFMVARDVPAGRLALVLEGARRAEIGIYAVVAHRSHAPARVRALLDFLARHFARARWEELAGRKAS